MAGEDVETLLRQARDAHATWLRASDDWVVSSESVQRVLGQIADLWVARAAFLPDHFERERGRLDAALRSAEKLEEAARVNLGRAEVLERHVHEQLRWEGSQRVQRSASTASWVTAAATVVALAVSAWSIAKASNPAPVHVEVIQSTPPSPRASGPWRPELVP